VALELAGWALMSALALLKCRFKLHVCLKLQSVLIVPVAIMIANIYSRLYLSLTYLQDIRRCLTEVGLA